MRSTFLLSLVAFVAVAGCGDHGVPSPDDLSMSDDMSASLDMAIPDDAKRIVTFTMFAVDYAQALCAHEMACGQLDAAQLSACMERNLAHTGWDQDVEIMKGRMEINELQCLNAIAASRCDFSDVAAWTSKCVAFLYNGNQDNGMACIAGAECKSGYCQHGGSDAGMPQQPTGCPGVCAPPLGTGAPCRYAGDCASDSFCDTTTTHQCQKLAALNESCTNNLGVGTGPDCQFGLSCPTFATTPTCQIPSMQTALHGACDPFQGGATPTPACPATMYCQVQYTASTTACTGAANDCNTLTAAYCDVASGFCQVPSSGKCEMKLAAGADCSPNNENRFSFVESQCADGAICDKLTGETKYTCHTLGGANASCNTVTDCKVGFDCVGGKCTAWIADHAPCATGSGPSCTSQSQQTTCVAENADAGAATTCEVAKSFGQACNPGFENSLCEPSDLVGSTQCVPNAAGTGGTCAPKCF